MVLETMTTPGSVSTAAKNWKSRKPCTGAALPMHPTAYREDIPKHIPNYLVQAILVTIFCCLPLGIVAIIFAAQVNGKVAAGDIAGAQSSSRTARTLVIVPVIVGAVVIGIALLAGLLGDPPPELINE